MRARLLKPGFFDDASLCRLPLGARLLFAGLWCLADREGKLLDIPRRIAIEIFPHDEAGIERKVVKWLNLLSGEWIHRYEADGKKCIRIINFNKHQRCHPDEKRSELPNESNENLMRIVLDSHTNRIGFVNESTSEAYTSEAVPSEAVPSEAETLASAPDRAAPSRSPRSNGAHSLPDGFDEWYALYPRHEARHAAITAWKKLSTDERAAATSGLRRNLPIIQKRIEKDGIDVGCPHPSTWLNQRRWEDEAPKKIDPYAHIKTL